MNNHEAIVWIDTETTGLDYKKEALLEIAVVITDSDLNQVSGYSTIIKTPKRKFRRMGDYVRKMHTTSGLLDELKHFGGKDVYEAETEILEMLDRYGLEKKLVLGGNSVHFDRRMLETRMPRLMARFTHQNLDVSSIGIVTKRWTPHVYEHIKGLNDNDSPHRAWFDILNSIEQLRNYRQFVFTTDAEDYLNTSRGEQ